MAENAPNDSETIEIGGDLRCDVRDAVALLSHATRSGFRTADGQTISETVVASILDLAALLGVSAGPTSYRGDGQPTFRRPTSGPTEVDSREGSASAPIPFVAVPKTKLAKFIAAYSELAHLLAPVTASTLRATKEETGLTAFVLGASSALRFTRWLWFFSLSFAVFVIFVEWCMLYWGPALKGIVRNPNDSVSVANIWMQVAEILVPFAYGGLGACVYLLRSAHSYIVERTFDERREPEYYGRIILGMISGGAIMLFVDSITNETGDVFRLSSAALGFLAGYSTDLLFQTIERVVAAILPRVSIESVRPANAAPRAAVNVPVGDLTLESLLAMHRDATDPDAKTLYASLIGRLRDRV